MSNIPPLEHLRLVGKIPFQEAGSAYNFFSTLPDVLFQVGRDEMNNPIMSVWAYVDPDGIEKVMMEYIKWNKIKGTFLGSSISEDSTRIQSIPDIDSEESSLTFQNDTTDISDTTCITEGTRCTSSATCYSTVKGSYEDVYTQTWDIYFPKITPSLLRGAAEKFTQKTGRLARVANSSIVISKISSSTREEDKEIISIILGEMAL